MQHLTANKQPSSFMELFKKSVKANSLITADLVRRPSKRTWIKCRVTVSPDAVWKLNYPDSTLAASAPRTSPHLTTC